MTSAELKAISPKLRRPNRGKSLESLVEASQSIVRLTKVSQAARHIGGGKIIRQAGPCDFFGAYADGKLLILDAKSGSLPLRLQTSADHLAEHQRLSLVRYGEIGAVSGLLCESTVQMKLFWCSWRLLTTARPSVHWDEMLFVGMSTHTISDGWNRIREFEANLALSGIRLAATEAKQ